MHLLSEHFGAAIVPIVIVFLAIAFVLTIKFIASRYKKIPPTKAGIFFGRKYKVTLGGQPEERGFMVVLGGGRVLMPLVESYKEMSTAAFQVLIDEDNIPNKDNVKFVIKGVATCKVSTVPENLYRAAGAFLEKSDDEIEGFIRNILKGHLRSIVGKLDINELLRERDNFNKQVVAESSPELATLGMELVNLVIQDITDKQGYIDALGERAVAQTKSLAAIMVAEAKRDQDIAVSNASQVAAATVASNEAKIAEANKDRDVAIANAKSTSETQRAAAEKAFQIASAAQDETLQVAEAKRDAAAAKAQTEVQIEQAKRREQELIVTVVRPAEAEKQKAILNAQAAAEVTKVNAEAAKNAAIAEGEGDASKQKALLLAQAEGTAAGKKQQLLAEAEGTKALAAALKEMDSAARIMLIMDKLPMLLDHGGDAMEKVARAIFESVAAPLGSIDNINIVDMGGGDGKGGVAKIAGLVPSTIAQFLTAAKASGIDFTALLNKLGVDPAKLMGLLLEGKPTMAAGPTEPPSPATPTTQEG